MRSILFLLLFQVTFTTFTFAQDSSRKKHIVYNVLIKDVHGETTRGTLIAITDTTLLINKEDYRLPPSHHFSSRDLSENKAPQQIALGYAGIRKIRIQRKFSAGRGALIGLITGAVIGAVIGFTSPTDQGIIQFTSSEKAAILGGFGAATGALFGAVIGALIHKSFLIEGDKMKFREMQTEMSGYL